MASNKVNINIPTPTIEIKLEGDWAKAVMMPQLVVKSIAEGYELATRDCSKDIIRIVKQALNTGLPPPGAHWPPLSPTTIKSHGNHTVYKMTGFYERSIGVHVYKGRVLIGIPLNIRAPGGLTINQLAILLEHGSTNKGGGGIPPRPLWAPSLEAYGGTKRIKKVVIQNIKNCIFKNTGISPKQLTIQ